MKLHYLEDPIAMQMNLRISNVSSKYFPNSFRNAQDSALANVHHGRLRYRSKEDDKPIAARLYLVIEPAQ